MTFVSAIVRQFGIYFGLFVIAGYKQCTYIVNKNKNGLHLLQIDPIVEHTFIQINYCIHGNIYINKAIKTEEQS